MVAPHKPNTATNASPEPTSVERSSSRLEKLRQFAACACRRLLFLSSCALTQRSGSFTHSRTNSATTRRRNTHHEDRTPAVLAHQQIDDGSNEKSRRPGGLQNACRLGPLVFRPDFRDQRRARRPFAADAQCREEPV